MRRSSYCTCIKRCHCILGSTGYHTDTVNDQESFSQSSTTTGVSGVSSTLPSHAYSQSSSQNSGQSSTLKNSQQSASSINEATLFANAYHHQPTPCAAEEQSHAVHLATPQGAVPCIGNELSMDLMGTAAFSGLLAGGLFGTQDADVSVHEVHLAANELDMLDEDFSDCDYDQTMTEDGGSPMKLLRPDGAATESDAAAAVNLFDTPHPQHFDDVSGYSAPSERDYCDVNESLESLSSQAMLERADAEGQVTTAEVVALLRMRAGAGPTGSAPPGLRADNQGEGQEQDEGGYSRYFSFVSIHVPVYLLVKFSMYFLPDSNVFFYEKHWPKFSAGLFFLSGSTRCTYMYVCLRRTFQISIQPFYC